MTKFVTGLTLVMVAVFLAGKFEILAEKDFYQDFFFASVGFAAGDFIVNEVKACIGR